MREISLGSHGWHLLGGHRVLLGGSGGLGVVVGLRCVLCGSLVLVLGLGARVWVRRVLVLTNFGFLVDHDDATTYWSGVCGRDGLRFRSQESVHGSTNDRV